MQFWSLKAPQHLVCRTNPSISLSKVYHVQGFQCPKNILMNIIMPRWQEKYSFRIRMASVQKMIHIDYKSVKLSWSKLRNLHWIYKREVRKESTNSIIQHGDKLTIGTPTSELFLKIMSPCSPSDTPRTSRPPLTQTKSTQNKVLRDRHKLRQVNFLWIIYTTGAADLNQRVEHSRTRIKIASL